MVEFQLALRMRSSAPFWMPLTRSSSPVTGLPLAFAILIVALDSVVLPGSLIAGAALSSGTAAPPCRAWVLRWRRRRGQRHGIEAQRVEHLKVDGRRTS